MNKKNNFKFVSAVIISISIIISLHGFIYLPKSNDDDDKPAEEVYKNIEVLKGTPAKDLRKIMNFMRASLSVKCSHCHIKNAEGEWIWKATRLKIKVLPAL